MRPRLPQQPPKFFPATHVQTRRVPGGLAIALPFAGGAAVAELGPPQLAHLVSESIQASTVAAQLAALEHAQTKTCADCTLVIARIKRELFEATGKPDAPAPELRHAADDLADTQPAPRSDAPPGPTANGSPLVDAHGRKIT